MWGKDAAAAGHRRRRGYRLRGPRCARDVGELAAHLAPLEERMSSENGAGPDDAIRVNAEHLKPARGPLDDEEERGVFYMSPVVTVTVSLFLAYTLFVTVLILVG